MFEEMELIKRECKIRSEVNLKELTKIREEIIELRRRSTSSDGFNYKLHFKYIYDIIDEVNGVRRKVVVRPKIKTQKIRG